MWVILARLMWVIELGAYGICWLRRESCRILFVYCVGESLHFPPIGCEVRHISLAKHYVACCEVYLQKRNPQSPS